MNATRICSVAGCSSVRDAKGLCHSHYMRLRRHGDPLGGRPGAVNEKAGQKACNICGKTKHVGEFYARTGRPGLYLSGCKTCRSERAKRNHEDNRERNLARSRANYWKNPDQWRNRKPVSAEARRVHRWNSRTRSRGQVVTREQMDGRFAAYGNRCWMCGSVENLTVDHVKPRSKGGPHLASNIRPACNECNVRKSDLWFGAKRISEFKRAVQ